MKVLEFHQTCHLLGYLLLLVVIFINYHHLKELQFTLVQAIEGYLSLELCNNFKVVELTEVMRQKGDLEFISFLNKIRVGIVDYQREKILLSRFIAKNNPAYPKHALHMFAENKPSVYYNELMLTEILGEVTSINAIDEVPQEIHHSDKQTGTIRARKIGDTGNLASVLNLKACKWFS